MYLQPGVVRSAPSSHSAKIAATSRRGSRVLRVPPNPRNAGAGSALKGHDVTLIARPGFSSAAQKR